MLTKFRKIYAKESKYKYYSNKFEQELNRFEQYLREESNSSNSGKPRSYRGYLIRFLVHIDEILDENVSQLESIHTVEQIERLTRLPQFEEFNRKTNRFYSATFASFKRYIKLLS